MPKFNLNWLYMIIAMMLLGLYLTNESGTATKNISYDEFQQYVRDGYISKVIGYDDNSVEAYVKPQHVGNVFRQDSSRVGKNPLITTEAPSRESLGNFLQKERDDAHFDGSINYEKKRNYFGAILWQILPFAFLIGFWIFMSRRMSGGDLIFFTVHSSFVVAPSVWADRLNTPKSLILTDFPSKSAARIAST